MNKKMKKPAILLMFFMLAGLLTAPGNSFAQKLSVPDKIPAKAIPFALTDVRLLASPFRDAMIRDQKYLLSLDSDRLLHTFRLNAGLASTAKPYGGWEAPDVELRGHSLGHFLSACALMYAGTGDERFKKQADTIVAELVKIQEALKAKGANAGYLSAFPEEFFDRVETRKRVWAPYYTIHKIMAGLLDMYQLCSNQQALDTVVKMADWVTFRVDRLSEEQFQRSLETEFGGMNELFANLYAVTGNHEHLRLAHKFDHRAVFDPLAQSVDKLDGLHANTQIPKAIGAARIYELTGEARYYNIANFFWQRVAHHRSYVIGGNSDDEHFFPVTSFSKHLGESSAETCNTYNMLKLTRHLFEWNPSAEMMDFYERGLFNHILASQDPEMGMMTYYSPMKPGSFKTFSTPEDNFWCCVGTGMENHAKYNDTIYFHDDESLYVNLFIPSVLNWKTKGLTVEQTTDFPQSETSRLAFQTDKPLRLALKIRVPSWAERGMRFTVNGKAENLNAKPGSYATIERQWKTGDVLELRLPMSLRIEAMPDDAKTLAILYGPVVLAGDLGKEGMEGLKRFGPYTAEPARVKLSEVPGFVVSDVKKILTKIKPVKGAPLTFTTVGLAEPREVRLIPFYRAQGMRYTVYWKVYSPTEWQQRQVRLAALAAREKAISERTVDGVRIGEAGDEKAHNFKGEKTDSGYLEDRRWRDSRDGWFSYELQVTQGERLTLLCTYWGSESRKRVFDIFVDGEKIATQNLFDNKPGEFFDVEYPLSATILRGKERVTIKFQAHPGSMAGGVFGLRIVRQTKLKMQ
ncbi:MAG: beta-L-arabinofuranosidase domain-containing protein [Acidobacteriota bacterium]